MVTNSAHFAMRRSRGCRQPVINHRVMHCANAHAGACLHDSSAIKALPPQTKRCVVMLPASMSSTEPGLVSSDVPQVQMSSKPCLAERFANHQLKPRQDIGAATHGRVGLLRLRNYDTGCRLVLWPHLHASSDPLFYRAPDVLSLPGPSSYLQLMHARKDFSVVPVCKAPPKSWLSTSNISLEAPHISAAVREPLKNH
ncbi:hypothetical protein IQ06DRAFT_116788 [Phaeosphaeriaceae sp. SRC1lsM3a]|nr:hypothetical protein IQ06DRAFT_116788 [Stagonospora sp. SRC1lsM3a]